MAALHKHLRKLALIKFCFCSKFRKQMISEIIQTLPRTVNMIRYNFNYQYAFEDFHLAYYC